MGVLSAVGGSLVFALAASAACAAPIGPEDLYAGCTKLAGVRSPASNQPATINFLNKTKGNVNIIWIDFGGSRRLYGTLGPNQNRNQPTYTGHVWLITDQSDNCLGAFPITESQAITVRDPAIREPENRAGTGGIRSEYDAVGTWRFPSNPSFECFRRFRGYDGQRGMQISLRANCRLTRDAPRIESCTRVTRVGRCQAA
jgi:hypothetical protein